MSRTKLRTEARKRIGDTGLLDHLLKHLAGKVVPRDGTDRVRRRCDADGKMQYWVENADLVNIRKKAGVEDPYWIPPPGWKLGDNINIPSCMCRQEVKMLREELSILRRYTKSYPPFFFWNLKFKFVVYIIINVFFFSV